MFRVSRVYLTTPAQVQSRPFPHLPHIERPPKSAQTGRPGLPDRSRDQTGPLGRASGPASQTGLLIRSRPVLGWPGGGADADAPPPPTTIIPSLVDRSTSEGGVLGHEAAGTMAGAGSGEGGAATRSCVRQVAVVHCAPNEVVVSTLATQPVLSKAKVVAPLGREAAGTFGREPQRQGTHPVPRSAKL